MQSAYLKFLLCKKADVSEENVHKDRERARGEKKIEKCFM
jgi:hypothetical protein